MYESFYFCRIPFIKKYTNVEKIDIILFAYIIDKESFKTY